MGIAILLCAVSYPATEFIDGAELLAQVEHHGRLTKRLGFIGCGGISMVGSDLANAVGNDLKAAVGFGARIRLSQKFPVDYAIDFSLNEEKEGILYISVGQRF